jgi:hypothetical protein
MKYLIIIFSMLVFIILLIKYRLRLVNFLPIILLYWDCVAVLFDKPADFMYSRNSLFLILFFCQFQKYKGEICKFWHNIFSLYYCLNSTPFCYRGFKQKR